eukprot:gnl/TRDRNA2_/TRDRNA2_144767_c1_seq1.p1 gnl/TRDRNA2_/TRDRNA2_144767_c1~~gnl/TRDRNA2_/TRDRNA2_144767_c1_seq1.p1  ORF type:complete len:165 (-),score=37.70 gnl/TRDRNA2_/TRDRNA2_144767_c1_seq1:76-570(-)
MYMRCCGCILLLALGAPQGAFASLRAFHMAPESNSTNATDMCLAGFKGATPTEQCDSLLHFLQHPAAAKAPTAVKLYNASKSAAKVPEACTSSCEETSEGPVNGDGSWSEVKCCSTVRSRLDEYESTQARCEWQSTCWKSLKVTLPKYIAHYKKLEADCDEKCK